MNADTESKFERVRQMLQGKNVLVAFSGGVDSSVLAHLTAVTANKTVLLIVTSETVPIEEREGAKRVAEELGLPLHSISVEWLAHDSLSKNPRDRCFECKKILAEVWENYASEQGLELVIEGTTASELEGYRPGAEALKESGVSSPFLLTGVTKQEIREYARENGLSIADRPSGACLATRFPYDTAITEDMLRKVESVETSVKQIFNVQCVRARYHGDLVRIEVGSHEIDRLYDSEKMAELTDIVKSAGFLYVTLDMQGYRTGAMDET
ncbi:MAG: ATP-dependent sacrificial sulfur transferase LarE [Candidatus Thorarchaeota archaeon]